MPDRSRPPRIHDIDKLSLPAPERGELDNGVPVYSIRSAHQEVIKLEVVFRAGRLVEHKQLAARSTLRLLREGTKQRDAATIAETLDYFGSTLSSPFNLDTAQLTLYFLARHAGEVLPLLAEILAEPAFPESELRNYVKRSKRKLQVDLRKTDVTAYREFTACIYGEDHPYGYNSSPEAFDALERKDLQRHFEDHYLSGNCFVIVSGGIGKDLIPLLNTYLAPAIRKGGATERPPGTRARAAGKLWLPRADSVQTAIRVGRRLFPRNHPDYEGVNILTTVLGGYFGSRLMANVREEKGFTYNIYAMVDSMVYDGSLYVSTEVGNDAVGPTLEEIYNEMKLLSDEPIENEEFTMVQNYLLGSYLSALDGPFNQAEVIRNYVVDRMPLDAFEQAVQTLRGITPRRLQELAETYLRPSDMWEVVVGGPEADL